ncbi:MAG: rRNA ((2503)-C(2))-methyltransferase RlmN [Firmicutes bacterium]|nr:rRNA ((2503)-C(2))-methyltransferase RlmN [Bacillota bacterium]
MRNILDLDLDELKKWIKGSGEKEFRAKQVFDWIYKGCFSFSDMKNIPESLRNKLAASFQTGIPEIVEKYKSRDDDTFKFLLKYSDGNIIETVVMQYKHGNSICVSTQIGCRMGCTFCASTLHGMVRNLTAGEILGQVLAAQKNIGGRISNVVLMGSGEPLDNFDNVTKFLDIVNSEYGLNIGQRHITLSTCGLVPKMRELADMNYQITLAVSLHAPNDEIRRQMMPVANKYSMAEILDACRYYISKTNRRITFEYSLVKGKNDSLENAEELSDILKGMLCHVNLIPVNAVVENGYSKPTQKDIAAFSAVLTRKGIETTVRREMGSDINAACGQLRRSYLDEQRGE